MLAHAQLDRPYFLGSHPIQHFPEHSHVELSTIQGDKALCKRLESMGIQAGKRVHILKNRGNGLLLKSENTRIAIRLSSAFAIEAQLLQP